MTLRLYKVTLGRQGEGSRSVNVLSETDVQAGDAASPLMQPGEAILAIEEQADDGSAVVDGPPAKTQAEELAPITPGAAAVSDDWKSDGRPPLK